MFSGELEANRYALRCPKFQAEFINDSYKFYHLTFICSGVFLIQKSERGGLPPNI